jgi:hypothetical protein
LGAPAGNLFSSEGQSKLIEQLPKVWIGYLLALATFVGEALAVTRHPELMKGDGLVVPPLEIYLPAFVALVYWLVCVHRYHVVLSKVPGWKHSITPNKAVWFHFIPLFNLYWVFRWPGAIAEFVNQRVGRPEMKGWIVGVGFLASALCRLLVDAALGLGILFFTCSYISAQLTRALGKNAARGQ